MAADDETPHHAVVPTDDGVPTLHSARYGQTYGSTGGAWTESRHVFLDGTGVCEQLAAGKPSRVLEVGWGTGLNWWTTAQHAHANGATLDFVSLEADPVPADVLRSLDLSTRVGLTMPTDAFFAAYEEAIASPNNPSTHRIPLTPDIALTLHLGDALSADLPGECDAVYLDAFSPDANPELWTVAFLNRLRAALSPGGVLATYSAKRSVRDALAEAGFEVERRPGPPGKRHVVRARNPEFLG